MEIQLDLGFNSRDSNTHLAIRGFVHMYKISFHTFKALFFPEIGLKFTPICDLVGADRRHFVSEHHFPTRV